jgi:putative FmdB family regulatory protein
MPIYDYQCPNCEYKFEELGKYEEIPECPKCGCPVKKLPIYLTASTGLPNGHCS